VLIAYQILFNNEQQIDGTITVPYRYWWTY